MYIYYIILLYFIVLYHFISLYCIVLHSMSCHDVILVLYIYCIILCFIAWCYNTPLRVFIYRIIHIILYIRYIIQYNIYIYTFWVLRRGGRDVKFPKYLPALSGHEILFQSSGAVQQRCSIELSMGQHRGTVSQCW